jgi:predicted nuclease of predicted toxin-antitoxin system
MRFLLDMGISTGVAGSVRSLGNEAEHLHDLELGTLPDAEILTKALRDGAVLVTHDLDFSHLLAASGAVLPSVILFRLRDMRPPNVVPRLRAEIASRASALAAGAVVSVTESQNCIRELPLES